MSETKTVTHWTLKRSGAGMTLTGKSGGCPVRVPEIKTVSLESGNVLAQTKAGEIYILRTAAA